MTAGGPTTFAAPRGMRDFFPEDMARRNRIFDAWKQAASAHGFLPYDAPVVESLELLTRKAGEEIVHQIYTFEDKSGRALALRPEMTPSLARMVAERQGELQFPLKWYAIAQCFRYERMTRGRKREHFQWNLDIIGAPDLTAEVEVLATALQALADLGLSRQEIRIHYSSRKLLAALLDSLGIPPGHHVTTFLALDKRGKIEDTEIERMLAEAGLDADQCRAVWQLLAVTTREQAAAMLPADTPALLELAHFEQLLAEHGIADAVVFDIAVVRGLAYYTGIVFEAFDAQRRFRALFGGGRYDNLLASVGGRPQTGVGLGFGDVVIAELLEDLGRLPPGVDAAQVAVGYMQTEQRAAATRLARQLREAGRTVDLALAAEKPKHFFGRISKGGIPNAAYLGPDDLARGSARLKNMATREETDVPLPG